MMDEQRLREMERDFADDDVSVRDYAAHGLALIADVRRLQQEADKALVTHIEAIEQGNGLAQRLIEQRDAAIAERDRARVGSDRAESAARENADRAKHYYAALTEARRVLREVEWEASARICPICASAKRHGHLPDCRLKAALEGQ